jgi:hypothetical protein
MSGAGPTKQNHERITATTEHILREFLSETSAHNQPCLSPAPALLHCFPQSKKIHKWIFAQNMVKLLMSQMFILSLERKETNISPLPFRL